MGEKNSFTYTLTPGQGQALKEVCAGLSALKPVDVPYTACAFRGAHLSLALYTSGKLVVQGKDAEEFVLFTLEPLVLQAAGLGYEDVLDPDAFSPHMGSDESGKGDIFGALVTVAVFVDETTSKQLATLGIRDSKTIADTRIRTLAGEARKILGRQNCAVVLLRPLTYNRLYAKVPNVNRLLAWCHARAIESLAEQRPDCTRAVIDQFARTESTIARALMARGKKLEIVQRHKAESDIAVAAASVLARDLFVRETAKLSEQFDLPFPKGAGPAVPQTLLKLIDKHGAEALWRTAKCHFKTVHEALATKGLTLPPMPQEEATP